MDEKETRDIKGRGDCIRRGDASLVTQAEFPPEGPPGQNPMPNKKAQALGSNQSAEGSIEPTPIDPQFVGFPLTRSGPGAPQPLTRPSRVAWRA
jgi:hypothetical protein